MSKPLVCLALLAALLGSGCQPAPSPTPSARAAASPTPLVACAPGDRILAEQRYGWATCVPASWHFFEKDQATTVPEGTDLVLDTTDFAEGPTKGLFGVIIIGTDLRTPGLSLGDWIGTYGGKGLKLAPLQWGNAEEALSEVGGNRYFAYTAHHVIVLQLNTGAGNLDLKSAMEARFSTWKFTY